MEGSSSKLSDFLSGMLNILLLSLEMNYGLQHSYVLFLWSYSGNSSFSSIEVLSQFSSS